jgi:hypothetical protein
MTQSMLDSEQQQQRQQQRHATTTNNNNNNSNNNNNNDHRQTATVSSFPVVLTPQLMTNTSTGGQRTSSGDLVRGWLAGQQERLLVGAGLLGLCWLLALFVAPLVRRRLWWVAYSNPKQSLGLGRSAAGPVKAHRSTPATTNWRFNMQHKPCSLASSSNEIGLFSGVGGGGSGGGGGGGSSSSSSSMAHKFGGSAAAAANYYGVPDSNGPDSYLEHDLVQSCSQSSNYEEFIQQQQQQQRLHQQPLYFNQAQLIESTTLSRRPLVPRSFALAAGATKGAPVQSQRHQTSARQRQQQHAQPATMRHNHSNVPLINELSGDSSSSTRINFGDLQRHSRAAPAQNHYSFGGLPPQPAGQRRATNARQEHIYDDVS